MSETAILDAPFQEVGVAVARAKASSAKVGEAVAQTGASGMEFVRLAQDSVEKAIVMGQELQKAWERFFARSESGVAERARALRGYFLQALGQSIWLMKDALYRADRAAKVASEPLRGIDSLADEVASLENIQQNVLSQWGVTQSTVAALAAMDDFPLHLDDHGDIHIGKSRVLLDTIVEHHKAGMPTETIVSGYDTLKPAEVYEAIAYYLRHKDDVEAYLQRRSAEAAILWQQIDASQPSKADLKAKIKERWSQRKADHAAPAE